MSEQTQPPMCGAQTVYSLNGVIGVALSCTIPVHEGRKHVFQVMWEDVESDEQEGVLIDMDAIRRGMSEHG